MTSMTTMTPTADESVLSPEPLVQGAGAADFHAVTEIVCGVVEAKKPPPIWYVSFGIAVTFLLVLLGLIGHLIWTGVGVWGNMVPVAWGWPIVNFVFWVGIGHAGTLISAILFLFRQHWRTGIN